MQEGAFFDAVREPLFGGSLSKDKANPSIETAIRRLDAAFAAGKLPWVSKPYWRKDASGKSWRGRGLIQLTHKVNYDRMGKIVGVVPGIVASIGHSVCSPPYTRSVTHP